MSDSIQGVGTSVPVGVTNTGQTGATPSTDQAANAQPQTATAPSDAADVGQTEALLAQIIQVANTVPATDDSKVQALQAAIASGTYQVDSMAIAKKLMGLDEE